MFLKNINNQNNHYKVEKMIYKSLKNNLTLSSKT